jgi:hypothetical protein
MLEYLLNMYPKRLARRQQPPIQLVQELEPSLFYVELRCQAEIVPTEIVDRSLVTYMTKIEHYLPS